MGRPNIRDPVSHGFVDRILECLLASSHGTHFGAVEAHAVDVEGLAFHIDSTHIDDAF